MPAVVFTPAARADVVDAYNWYERRQLGLGAGLSNEIDQLVARISRNPVQFQLVTSVVRRAMLRRFPYALFFKELHEVAQVIACFHTSRDPIQWHRRI